MLATAIDGVDPEVVELLFEDTLKYPQKLEKTKREIRGKKLRVYGSIDMREQHEVNSSPKFDPDFQEIPILMN